MDTFANRPSRQTWSMSLEMSDGNRYATPWLLTKNDQEGETIANIPVVE